MNTGVGCHTLFQGIFLIQGLNTSLLCLLHCRQILYFWATREALFDSILTIKSQPHKDTNSQTHTYMYILYPRRIYLDKEMVTHSSVLAWRIPGMGAPDGLPSMGSHRVGHDWSDLAAAASWFALRKQQAHKEFHSLFISKFFVMPYIWSWQNKQN